MVSPAQIEAAIAGHKDTDHFAVPVSLLREVARDYARFEATIAQFKANAAIGDICASLSR